MSGSCSITITIAHAHSRTYQTTHTPWFLRERIDQQSTGCNQPINESTSCAFASIIESTRGRHVASGSVPCRLSLARDIDEDVLPVGVVVALGVHQRQRLDLQRIHYRSHCDRARESVLRYNESRPLTRQQADQEIARVGGSSSDSDSDSKQQRAMLTCAIDLICSMALQQPHQHQHQQYQQHRQSQRVTYTEILL